jgi:hypothetical protein
MTSSVLVVSGNLFVAIICSVSEQESKVSVALAILRNNKEYDLTLERWWRTFADTRTRAIWIFFFSIPFLFVALASSAYLKAIKEFPSSETYTGEFLGAFGAVILLLVGTVTFTTVLRMNRIFRANVLGIQGMFKAPYIYSDRDHKVE